VRRNRLIFRETVSSDFDGLAKSQNPNGKVKSSKFKAHESRVMRRTFRTPQSQRDEVQRGNWAFYEAVYFDLK